MGEAGGSIILFPEFEKLKAQVEALRASLSMRLMERDTLQYVEAKNIETQYMLELGVTEYKIYQAQCGMLRAKRKLEMIRAKLNRQEHINPAEIEAALDEEFRAYQEELDAHLKAINDAIERSHAKYLTAEETMELKTLYRQVVKALHPDLHPDLTLEQLRLFEHAVEAYRAGDLQTMRMISAMMGSAGTKEKEDSIARLYREKERLSALLSEIMQSIEMIRSSFPFTERELLSHPEQVSQRRAELEKILQQYEETMQLYQRQIDELLR